MLLVKGTYTPNIKKIIVKLSNHVKSSLSIQNEPFLFFYRIVIQTAFSCP